MSLATKRLALVLGGKNARLVQQCNVQNQMAD
jgi:hypothetical protein